ncbi:MAG: hypothetical protein IJ593_06835, partial [Lachnospiraceae bacterium]|nr:hypothetical protein [Lachnospiraceae bacterium]
ISKSHSRLNRWTAIIIRYDSVNRSIYLLAVDGMPAAKPVKPALTKNDAVREICLAYIYVPAGATNITTTDITDTIEDDELCGFVSTLLHSAQSGVKKVRQLPIPTADCQGEIYYLTQRAETAGETYSKGYYACEPSNYSYNFIEFSYISDSNSNRPLPTIDYVDILFNAIDTNRWYRCVETEQGIYEWQEVTVSSAGVLPTASESTYDRFYLVGIDLYKGNRIGSDYKWSTIIKDRTWTQTLNVPTTGWTSATDTSGNTYYYKTFVFEDLSSSDTPIISLKVDDIINLTTLKTAKSNYNNLLTYECGNGTITFYSTKIPTSPFTLFILGV